jgi:hypothetical protein
VTIVQQVDSPEPIETERSPEARRGFLGKRTSFDSGFFSAETAAVPESVVPAPLPGWCPNLNFQQETILKVLYKSTNGICLEPAIGV